MLAEVREMNIFAGPNADHWNHAVAPAEMKRLGLHYPGKAGQGSHVPGELSALEAIGDTKLCPTRAS